MAKPIEDNEDIEAILDDCGQWIEDLEDQFSEKKPDYDVVKNLINEITSALGLITEYVNGKGN